MGFEQGRDKIKKLVLKDFCMVNVFLTRLGFELLTCL